MKGVRRPDHPGPTGSGPTARPSAASTSDNTKAHPCGWALTQPPKRTGGMEGQYGSPPAEKQPSPREILADGSSGFPTTPGSSGPGPCTEAWAQAAARRGRRAWCRGCGSGAPGPCTWPGRHRGEAMARRIAASTASRLRGRDPGSAGFGWWPWPSGPPLASPSTGRALLVWTLTEAGHRGLDDIVLAPPWAAAVQLVNVPATTRACLSR